jgi:hypothetical protein
MTRNRQTPPGEAGDDRPPTRGRRTLSALVGIGLAGRTYLWLAADPASNAVTLLAIPALAGLVGGLLMHALILRRLCAHLRRKQPAWSAAWPSLALLAAISLFVLRPAAWPPPPWTPIRDVVIQATGDRNPAARSNEVWFRGLIRPDGTCIPPDAFEHDGRWVLRDGALLARERPGAPATWRGPLSGSIRLRFDRHRFAGIVRIHCDGETVVHDLYAPNAGVTRLQVNLPVTHPVATMAYRAVLHACVITTNAVALYVVGALLGLAVAGIARLAALSGARRDRRFLVQGLARIMTVLLLVAFAVGVGRDKGPYAWSAYWQRAWAEPARRLAARRHMESRRSFLRTHLPRGALVLAAPRLGTELVMLFDCHIMRAQPPGMAGFHRPDVLADYRSLMDPDLPWSERRALLQRHALRWVFFTETAARAHPWLTAVAQGAYPHRQCVLYRLPPPAELPVTLDPSEGPL